MQNSSELARIDRYTCKFENPVMEDRYMGEKWERVKKPVNFAIIFLAIMFVFDAYNVFNMLGGEFKPLLLGYPFFILLFSATTFGELSIACFLLCSSTYFEWFYIDLKYFPAGLSPRISLINLLKFLP